LPYRRYVTDITEEATSITFALVVRDAANSFTYGGGYATITKPMTEAKLDAAVAQIVQLGDNAYPKQLTQADRDAMTPISRGSDTGILEDTVRQKNKADYPDLGRVRR